MMWEALTTCSPDARIQSKPMRLAAVCVLAFQFEEARACASADKGPSDKGPSDKGPSPRRRPRTGTGGEGEGAKKKKRRDDEMGVRCPCCNMRIANGRSPTQQLWHTRACKMESFVIDVLIRKSSKISEGSGFEFGEKQFNGLIRREEMEKITDAGLQLKEGSPSRAMLTDAADRAIASGADDTVYLLTALNVPRQRWVVFFSTDMGGLYVGLDATQKLLGHVDDFSVLGDVMLEWIPSFSSGKDFVGEHRSLEDRISARAIGKESYFSERYWFANLVKEAIEMAKDTPLVKGYTRRDRESLLAHSQAHMAAGDPNAGVTRSNVANPLEVNKVRVKACEGV
jgi:hypothetical protein